MTPPTAIDRSGYVHEALLYESDQHLLDVVVPFLEDGRRQGEALLVDVEPRTEALLREALARTDDVLFVEQDHRYGTPAAAIRGYLARFEQLLAGGASQIRAVGQIPDAAVATGWRAWGRYEAVVNHAYARVPVWGMCLYDARSTPADALGEVRCTHPRLTTSGAAHVPNADYQEPARWLAERPPPLPDPLERTSPVVELRDPWPHQARAAVGPLLDGRSADVAADLATATSEIVANARAHGRHPVQLRVWADDDRVVIAVDDRGSGPDDPHAGLVPPERRLGDGGLGLWIAHQLCSDVVMHRTDEGFRVRITADAPRHVDRLRRSS